MTAAMRVAGTTTGRPPMELRPYQRACVDAVFDFVRTRPGNPLAVIPTGGGKSLVMGTLIGEALANHPGGRALILAHRKELIQQNVRAVATVLPLGRIGIYSAGLRRKDLDTPILVAGIQSLATRPYDAGPFDVILIDEAHLVPRTDGTRYANYIKAARQLNPHVVFVGLTATPYRMDSGLLHRGDDALFSEIAYEASVAELIADGYLCALTSRGTATRLSTEGVGTRGGEFIPGQLQEAVDQDPITAAVVDELVARCADRHKWLVFCAGVDHAEHVATALRARGIPTAAVHGSLDHQVRAERLEAFREGTLRALTSMDVLTTGFDEPAIDAIALLRPTKSTGLYVQMVGRGFRIHPSKTDTLVLDFAGNVARHGPIDQIVVKDRAPTEGDGTAPTKECPECRRIVLAGLRSCPCGFQFPEPEPAPIAPRPSELPVLSTESPPITWYDLDANDGVEYSLHTKPDKPPSLRVSYYAPGELYRAVASEWICLEHGGFARTKAEQWWRARDRTKSEVPLSVTDALRLVVELRRPVAIATQPEGKFTRIVQVRFEEEQALADDAGAGPAAADRRCTDCRHFLGTAASGLCLHWNAEPPAHVIPEGCDAFDQDGLPF